MRAARISAFGDASVFQVDDVPIPDIGPDDVLVRVVASSVNPVDWKMREGYQRLALGRRPPLTLGMDVSGVVEKVGSRVTSFAPGDEVFSSPSHRREGTYAEYVAIRARELAKKPSSLSHAEAASLPLVALTAWGCLMKPNPVKPGERVFIQAGSGGVGTVAIQMAKRLGAHVSTTCSARNIDLVRSLGADEVVDYTTANFWEVLPQQDRVLESLGGEAGERALQIVRRGGLLTTINSGLVPRARRFGPYVGVLATAAHLVSYVGRARLGYGVRVRNVIRVADAGALAEIARWADEGDIRAVIDRHFPLEEIGAAHEYVQTGRTRGKVVIDVASA